MNGPRYAVYFAPPQGSELECTCSALLGRCARTKKILEQPNLPGIAPARLTELTASPRHYGLHGTLKPPFFLTQSTSEADLLDAVDTLAASREAFHLPPLKLETIESFLALTPSASCPELEDLARTCVIDLDGFRRPPGVEELARRRKSGLTPEQDRLLMRWGYPYVLEEFRFHLTLTGRIEDPYERALARTGIAALLAPFANHCVSVEEITVFRQDNPDTAFMVMRNFALPHHS